MAANRAYNPSLCRSLVPSILVVIARCRRAPGGGGLGADHTTVWRWVQRYGPELEQRMRRHLKPTNKSWRVDEAYVRVKGRWCYLYRAIDSTGATIDFLLSALREANAANACSVKRSTNRRVPNAG